MTGQDEQRAGAFNQILEENKSLTLIGTMTKEHLQENGSRLIYYPPHIDFFLFYSKDKREFTLVAYDQSAIKSLSFEGGLRFHPITKADFDAGKFPEISDEDRARIKNSVEKNVRAHFESEGVTDEARIQKTIEGNSFHWDMKEWSLDYFSNWVFCDEVLYKIDGADNIIIQDQMDRMCALFAKGEPNPPIIDTQDAQGIFLKVFYEQEMHQFLIQVGKDDILKEERIWATYKPLFGIDAEDMAQINEVAEVLASSVEAELLKPARAKPAAPAPRP